MSVPKMKGADRMAEELRINEKYLLRIVEAAEYYGIGIKRLRRIAEEGEHIFAVQVENNRWMIHRRKFEEYLNTYYFSGKKYEGDIPGKVF